MSNINPKQILTKKFLELHYIKLKKSIKQIAKEFNLRSPNSIAQYLKKFKLHRRNIRNSKEILTKEYLEFNYIKLAKSMQDIACEIGLKGKLTISKALKKHKIPIRTTFIVTEGFKRCWTKSRTGYGDISGSYWSTVKYSAKTRELKINITPKYAWELFLKQNRKCALSGIEIKFNQVGEDKTEKTASLDRIDSSKGYIIGNVQWIHKTVQTMKWNLKQEIFTTFCKAIANNANILH